MQQKHKYDQYIPFLKSLEINSCKYYLSNLFWGDVKIIEIFLAEDV